MITIGQVRVGFLERFHTVENVWVETIMFECLWRVEAFVCPSPAFAGAFNFTAFASTAVENAFSEGIAVNLYSRDPLIREEFIKGGTEGMTTSASHPLYEANANPLRDACLK